jgi:hypothetical protein
LHVLVHSFSYLKQFIPWHPIFFLDFEHMLQQVLRKFSDFSIYIYTFFHQISKVVIKYWLRVQLDYFLSTSATKTSTHKIWFPVTIHRIWKNILVSARFMEPYREDCPPLSWPYQDWCLPQNARSRNRKSCSSLWL